MENREISTTKKMITEFIGGVFLYGIIFGIIYIIIYWILYFLFSSVIKSTIIFNIVNIIIEAVYVFFIYKYSIKSIFKKRTINENDLNDLIKKYMIFSIVFFVITTMINFFSVNSNVNKIANSRSTVEMENVLLKYYDKDELSDYYQEKENTINSAKNTAYKNLFFTELGFGVLYFIVVVKHKETFSQYINL